MGLDSLWKFIVLIICLALSALFSAAETALMSLSKIRIKQMLENKVKGANRVSRLLDDPAKILSAILIGNNVVNIGASSLMTSLTIDMFGNTGVGISTGVMTFLILIFGEITPKSLAAQNSEKLSIKLSGFIEFVTILVGPISFILTKITNFLLKLLGGEVNENQPFLTREELRTIVNVGHKEGILEGEERDIIYNVFDFGNSQVNEIMITRTDVVALDIHSSYEEIVDVISQSQFSRIPVYDDTIDNIVGILYIKDLMFLQINKESKLDLKEYMREPYFTYEFKLAKELFKEMRSNRVHMVIVLDEYGGTEGIITIEDLIEEMVGDIEDEYDEEANDIVVIKEDEYLVDGDVKLPTINDLIGTHIESEDFDTIAGFVIDIAGKIPKLGEVIEYENIKFIIEAIEKNRLEKIRILT